MPDPSALALAAAAGACATVAALAALDPLRAAGARELLARRGAQGRPAVGDQARSTFLKGWLAGPVRWLGRRLELAGRPEPAEKAAVVAAATTVAAALAAGITAGIAVGTVVGVVAGLAGAGAFPVLLLSRLRAAATVRRERLLGQLVPLLELMSLELSGGASPLPALEAVLARSRSELGSEIRSQLIGSRVAGSASFESRLSAMAERLDLPPLHTLAMILGLSRDYGSGVSQGVRALVADLRRARRRQVIEVSRSALNRVLVPAAFGILLPFMSILLFPAVAVLSRSFGG